MPSSPSVLNLSSIRHFSNKLVFHIRWSKYWSFSISPSKEYSVLTSSKMDWFDLQGFALQGSLGSLLQHHILKASILWCSAFVTVQLSQLYVTTRKTISMTILLTWLDLTITWLYYYYYLFGRVMPLLFNTLSRFFILFLSRGNLSLISWLQSLSPVILEPKKKKSVTTSTFSPYICHEVMGLGATILVCPFVLIFSLKPSLSFSSFTLIKRFWNSSSLSAIRVVPSAYLRLLMFLLTILTPACNSSSLSHDVLSINKQGDSRQPCLLSQSWTYQCFIQGSNWCFLAHI